ncbi:FeoA family protein [Hydrogenimonas urashimensis]|uniref:FeoA family protein n=1 Tax=Hydrogenimonas urashimensis TaxID=2740515 RepID=UPI0019165377|nr:FeoA family protein [Hydrogenimonas urashimensis]
MTLADLQTKQKAIVKKVGQLGELRARLMELGVFCGEPIQLVRRSPFGDPLEIKVADTHLAIREEDAEKIEVEPISHAHRTKREKMR